MKLDPEEATKATKSEKVLAGAAIAVDLVPVVGGAIGSALSLYANTKANERMARFLSAVAAELDRLGVTQEGLAATADSLKDEVVRLALEVRLSGDEEKITALERAAVSNIVADDVALIRKRRLNRIAVQLDPEHLVVLRIVSGFRPPPSLGGNEFDKVPSGHTSLDYVAAALSSQFDRDLVRVLLNDLVRHGLVIDDSAGRLDARPLGVIGLSNSGREFLDWIAQRSEKK